MALTINGEHPHSLPASGWYKEQRVTVYAVGVDGSLARAAIKFENGGRGMVVGWDEIIFEPVSTRATLEYLKGMISV